MWTSVVSCTLIFTLVSSKSILSQDDCGDPTKGKDASLVEIHPLYKSITEYCYGVLISNKHILTDKKCEWVLNKDFGGIHVRIFLGPNKTNNASKLASGYKRQIPGLDFGLMILVLKEPVDSQDLSPICLKEKTNLNCKNSAICPTEIACDTEGDSRRAGYPLREKDENGRHFLKGFRFNSCDISETFSYIDVNAYRLWIEFTLNQLKEENQYDINVAVNGLCPAQVTKQSDNSITCDKSKLEPGYISVKSKTVCQDWQAEPYKPEDEKVVVSCKQTNGDGEDLDVQKSSINCPISDCSGSNDPNQRVLLSELKNCQSHSDQSDNCGFSETPRQTDLSIDTDSFTSCDTEDNLNRCQFPFEYEGRLRFECVKRSNDESAIAECPVDSEQNLWKPCGKNCPLMKYHSHEELIQDLNLIQSKATDTLTETFSIGTSVQDRDLKGIRLHLDNDDDLKPMVKLVGNMHGNEPTGRELLIHLAKYILYAHQLPKNQGKRDLLLQRARQILQNTDLWILPTLNPDGFARGKEGVCFGSNYNAGRTNEKSIDLNRNFPTWRDKGKTVDQLKKGRAKETQLAMDWILQHPFVLSANFHDGAVLVNYPFDDYRQPFQRGTGQISKTPDHEEFLAIAKSYTRPHPYMEDATKVCEHWGYFRDGITNGAKWYEVLGGMQDFNYDFTNAMEVTIEVSCCKFSQSYRLISEWNYNVESLISFVEMAQRGLRGYVKDADFNIVSGAEIQVEKLDGTETGWRQKNVTSDAKGRYWRILLPGDYIIRAVKGDKVSVGQRVSFTEEQKFRRIDLIFDLETESKSRPVVFTTESIEKTSERSISTSKPLISTTEPSSSTSEPSISTTKVASTTAKIVTENTAIEDSEVSQDEKRTIEISESTVHELLDEKIETERQEDNQRMLNKLFKAKNALTFPG